MTANGTDNTLSTFGPLAVALDELEGTSSRASLSRLLADIFRRVPPDESASVAYLIQGRIAPVFESIQIGMAEKMVVQTLSGAFGLPIEEVSARYRTAGDLGDVARELRQQYGGSATDLAIDAVFSVLCRIAETSGVGANAQRVELLRDLLVRLDPLSDKYLIRIVLGNLRLGVGDPTILDAMAATTRAPREAKRVLEGAYNRTSDLGLIARTLKEAGIEAVGQLQIQVGHPVRPELAARLPGPEAVVERLGRVLVQDKYDGIRVQIHKDGDRISLFSRNLENLTDMFPEIAEGARRQIAAGTAILDTETLVYHPLSGEFLPFQMTSRRRRKYRIGEMAEELPLSAFAFDILYRDGTPLLDLALEERLGILRETVHPDGSLIVAGTRSASDAGTLAADLGAAISQGLEGIVVKRPASKYEAGARNFNWVKLKRHASGALRDTIDCVILGLFAGRGKRAGFGAGALLAGIYDADRDEFVTVTRIGTGLSDDEWREVYRRSEPIRVDHKPARVDSLIVPSIWVEPEIVIEVLADEITRSPIHTAGKTEDEPGYALRFPRVISFRSADKRPEDATTVAELLEMYRQQDAVRRSE